MTCLKSPEFTIVEKIQLYLEYFNIIFADLHENYFVQYFGNLFISIFLSQVLSFANPLMHNMLLDRIAKPNKTTTG